MLIFANINFTVPSHSIPTWPNLKLHLFQLFLRRRIHTNYPIITLLTKKKTATEPAKRVAAAIGKV